MAKVLVCDKCGAEIKRSSVFSLGEGFEDMMGDMAEQLTPERKSIVYPELCSKCAPKFDALIDKFNKEIKSFLAEK